MKKIFIYLFLPFLILGCTKVELEPYKPTTSTKPTTPSNPPVTAKPKTLSDVVDDAALVDYLPGKWAHYFNGEDNKFSSQEYSFDRSTDKMMSTRIYNDYYTLYDIQRSVVAYNFKIQNNVLSVPSSISPDGYRKLFRMERVSEDEMKIFLISEGASGYSEISAGIHTKSSDVERPSTEVIKAGALKGTLSGVWKESKSTLYKNESFDFTSNKNYYQYSYESSDGAKTIRKYEFKVDEQGTLYHRLWATTIDPAWNKYFLDSKTKCNK